MASPLHIPRVNNNDDSVRIVGLGVSEGDFVTRGQIVGAVETDKAVLDVSVERDGYVLKIVHRAGETASVGSVLLWIGEIATERVPELAPAATAPAAAGGTDRPTAKAQAMLRELGLAANVIPTAGERLTVADIESWLATQRQPVKTAGPGAHPAPEQAPSVPGEYRNLSAEERGMFFTVLWHRDRAAAAPCRSALACGPFYRPRDDRSERRFGRRLATHFERELCRGGIVFKVDSREPGSQAGRTARIFCQTAGAGGANGWRGF